MAAPGKADVVVAGAGAGLFAGCTWLATGGVQTRERLVFERVNHQFIGIKPLLQAARQLGIGPALPVLAVGALASRHPRLAAASLLSLAAEKGLEVEAKKLTGRRRPAQHSVRSRLRGDAPTSGGSYPSDMPPFPRWSSFCSVDMCHQPRLEPQRCWPSLVQPAGCTRAPTTHLTSSAALDWASWSHPAPT